MRLFRSGLAVLCAVLALNAAGTQHYGKPSTLKTETKISAILAHPEQFKGKRVRVRGVVIDVCPKVGCYLRLKGDQRFQELMFKVDEGVIVFPSSMKGSEAIVEGVLAIKTFSEQEQREMCPIEAQALNRKFDPAKIHGPIKVIRIDGLGADIRS